MQRLARVSGDDWRSPRRRCAPATRRCRRRPARASARSPRRRAIAASARCTVASCSRRRIHHCAGRGPMNVHTSVSTPNGVDESMMSWAPALSHSMAASGSSGGLPSRTSRGSSGSLRRSATICAAHRFPRPTWRNSCLSVQSGQVGTGVDGSAVRISSPNACGLSMSAARKSTSRTYSGARLAKRDRQATTSRAAPWCRGGCRCRPAARRGSARRRSAIRLRPSARASAAPRQKCLPPENDRCLPALSRSMSKRCGSVKTLGSRLAPAR